MIQVNIDECKKHRYDPFGSPGILKMCDAKSTRFFRPWKVEEMSEAIESIDRRSERRTVVPAYIKREDDSESVVSSSSSSPSSLTCEESNTGSYSENDTTLTLATSSTTTSPRTRQTISSPSRRRKRRRRRESPADVSSTRASSCSANSEEAVESNRSLDVLRNFVFNSHISADYHVPSSGSSVVRERSSTSEDSPLSFSTLDSSASAFGPAYHPVDYLQRMALQHASDLRGNCTDGVTSSFLRPFNVIDSGNVSLEMPLRTSSAHEATQMAQCLYYGFPSPGGVHQFPQGLYPASMEEAVELIHRQDAVAKQMKKLRPKKFRCEHCDVAFSNNGQLKGHVRIHTGERPFKCDAEGCGKSFTRNEELTRHKRIHTGLRPHSCVLCGKRFGRKDHLKKHTRTHDSRDPYRVSATALGVFALGSALPRGHPLPPYVYPI